MDFMHPGYPQEVMATKAVNSIERTDMMSNLKDKLQYHQLQIKKIEGMMNLLERNQDFVKMIDLFREIH